MSDSSLKKGITIVLMVNILNLFFRLLLNFFMPKYLNVDVYADYKFYQLLVGYIGMLHFGFVDGVYIKFGGKKINSISDDEIGQSLVSLVVMEIVVTVIAVIVGVIINQPALLLASTAIIATEVMWLFQYIYQATGEFKKYGRVTSFNIILLFAFITILMIFNCQVSYLYMSAYSLAIIIIALILRIKSGIKIKKEWINLKKIVETCKNNITIGIFVMIGNFASQLLTSMDRWFIKVLMSSVDFAQYSFAASLESFMSFAITPFSVTLYNFFCREPSDDAVRKIEEQIYVFAVAIIASAFPAKWILEHFITNYMPANDVLFYLFASKGFNIVVVCIFVNLYKAMKMQKKYSLKMAAIIGIGFITNALMYLVLQSKESFAIATLLTTIVWFVLCKLEFKQFKLSFKSEFYLFVEVAAFVVLGNNVGSILGFITYVILTVILSFIMMKEATLSFIKMAMDIVKKKN